MPRPRSEEIPLELIKKASNSVIDMAPKIAIVPRPQVKEETEEGVTKKPEVEEEVSISSEETSFIASQRRNSKIGGNIETV